MKVSTAFPVPVLSGIFKTREKPIPYQLESHVCSVESVSAP